MRVSLLLILFFLVADLYSNAAIGQTEQQSILIGGGFNFSYNMQDSFHTTTINVAPTFGYFVVKNFLLGASIGIGITSDNKAKGLKNRLILNNSFTPFARYYFMKEKLRPFLFARFGYQTNLSLVNGGSSSSDGITGGGGAGFDYFATRHVAIEATLGYSGTKISNQNLSSTVAFGLGLQYFLHPKIKKENQR